VPLEVATRRVGAEGEVPHRSASSSFGGPPADAADGLGRQASLHMEFEEEVRQAAASLCLLGRLLGPVSLLVLSLERRRVVPGAAAHGHG
jgi:hypothetical protein